MKQNREQIKRGEIYMYDFGPREGSIQTGYRPVLVLQDERISANAPTVVVAAITTATKKRYLPSHIDLDSETGLKEPSMVLLEQIQSVNKSELTRYIGRVDNEDTLRKIDVGVKKLLGLWKYKDWTKDIRCLCGRCMSEYRMQKDYIVRRVDPMNKVKDQCDKCGNMGYDYYVYKRGEEK